MAKVALHLLYPDPLVQELAIMKHACVDACLCMHVWLCACCVDGTTLMQSSLLMVPLLIGYLVTTLISCMWTKGIPDAASMLPVHVM